MPDQTEPFKIWLPRTRTLVYSVEIDGTDVTTEILSAEFTRGILGIGCPCKVTLVDPDGDYAKLYTGGEVIEFKCDLTTGATSQWKGKLERPQRQSGDNYTIELIGSHYQSDLLDITVTEEYDEDTPISDIFKELVDGYLTGFTYTNVGTETTTPKIKWNNKPLYDCILDLCTIANYDCYVDSDKDFHFFEKESNVNQNEAIIWNDNLREMVSFGADNLDVRNRIIVYGEDESGLPIVYQTDDSTSQSTYGVKEKIVKDSSVRSYEQAKSLGDAMLANEKEKESGGEFRILLASYLNPGDMVWIAQPVLDISGTYRVVQFTSKIPMEETTVIISKEKTIPGLFKERKVAELGSENLTNPYKMTGSLNLTFDAVSDYDNLASSNIEISEGNLKTISGAAGSMVSQRRSSDTTITSVHLKIKGDALSGTVYKISTDDGGIWETVKLEEKVNLVHTGDKLRLKIELNSADTRIDSAVVMYK